MDGVTLLRRARQSGIKLRADGEQLHVRGPKRYAALAKELFEHKAELMALLREPPDNDITPEPLGKVGRHGDPCMACGHTWWWPTSRGGWVCSGCVCGNL